MPATCITLASPAAIGRLMPAACITLASPAAIGRLMPAACISREPVVRTRRMCIARDPVSHPLTVP